MKNVNSIHKKISMAVGVTALTCAISPMAFADWSVQGAQILDPNKQNFIYRGISLGEFVSATPLLFLQRDLATTGANAIKVPVYSGTSAATLEAYLKLCKENKSVCVFSYMGAYGYTDSNAQDSPAGIPQYWLSPSIKAVLDANKDYAIINIANGPTGNSITASHYLSFTTLMIYLMRLGGVENQLMIDGGNWGQDWERYMLNNAEQILASDTQKNLFFSVHMYEAYNDPVVIREYLQGFIDKGLPIVVGEFGPKSRKRIREYQNPYAPNTDVAEDSIMAIAQELGVGYLGWSWNANPEGFTELNLVDTANPNLLTPWGDYLLNSANGIKATAKLATHFVNSSSSSSATSSTTSSASSSGENRQPYAIITSRVVQERCGYVYANATAVESTDPDGDALSYEWEIYNSYSGTYEYQSGEEITFSMRPLIHYTFTLYVSDGRGGRSTASKTLYHSYSDNCIGSSSSSSTRSLSSSSGTTTSSSIPSTSSSSSIRPSSISSSSRSSSSAAVTRAVCSYHVQSQWGNGFTASIRLKNITNGVINGWSVNWQYPDGSKITGSWNAALSGSNPYSAKNLSWNANIQPGQTVEFGFQGSKPAGTAVIPIVSGNICQ
jgi:mannan endo-1,4-beta-mannosidase